MAYFAVSVFLSAFLLFQVEPMIGKFILPWFGGTSAVWSTVLMFFQILLTGGYAYAYWLLHRGTDQKRVMIHIALLAVSLLTMLVWDLYGNRRSFPPRAGSRLRRRIQSGRSACCWRYRLGFRFFCSPPTAL